MSEIAVVDNAGGVGFVSPSDRRGFELNPQAWTDMNSVRMDEGGVEPAWGYRPGGVHLDSSCHSIDYMSNQLGDENYYIIGSDTKIELVYVAVDTGLYTKKQIGPVPPSEYMGNYDLGNTWVTTSKDSHMVMTNNHDRPQMILQANIADAVAVKLAGFDENPTIAGQQNYIACKTIIAFSGFLVAGDITFGGDRGRQSNMVAWSDRSDTGSLPTSWDYSDTSTLAGNSTMPADYGAIVALEKIRDELMIYCERGAFRMQFTGGQYVFRIVPAYDTVGALNPRSTCSHKGANIIVSYTDIVRTDGQYPESICNGTVRKELFEQLSPENSHKVQVIEYPRKSEVIIVCPDKQDDKWCGKVLAWSWITQTWSVRHGLLMRCMNTLPKLVSAIDPENKEARSSYDEIYRAGKNPPITDGVTTPPIEETLQTVQVPQFTGKWKYRVSTIGGVINSGEVFHSVTDGVPDRLIIVIRDYDGVDRSSELATVQIGTTITVPGMVWTVTKVNLSSSFLELNVTPATSIAQGVLTFVFDTSAMATLIESMPSNQEVDNYALVDATYGTLLADEGRQYIFGIAAEPDPDFPSEPLSGGMVDFWAYEGAQQYYGRNSVLWASPYVERRGINLTNDETVQVVTAVYPKMEGSGQIRVRVGAVDFIGGKPAAIRWDNWMLFTPEKDYRVTCRVAGRRHAIKFEAVSEVDEHGDALGKFQSFRLTGYDIEYSQAGRR